MSSPGSDSSWILLTINYMPLEMFSLCYHFQVSRVYTGALKTDVMKDFTRRDFAYIQFVSDSMSFSPFAKMTITIRI